LALRMVLEKLLPRFEAQGIRYALIGGLALGLLGVGRATMDIDFLVLRDDMPVVDRLMTELGMNVVTAARMSRSMYRRLPFSGKWIFSMLSGRVPWRCFVEPASRRSLVGHREFRLLLLKT